MRWDALGFQNAEWKSFKTGNLRSLGKICRNIRKKHIKNAKNEEVATKNGINLWNRFTTDLRQFILQSTKLPEKCIVYFTLSPTLSPTFLRHWFRQSSGQQLHHSSTIWSFTIWLTKMIFKNERRKIKTRLFCAFWKMRKAVNSAQ